MKKLLASLLLVSAAVSAKAAIFITNNTDCDVQFFLYAHDAVNSSLTSQMFTITALNSVAFNNVSSLNTSPGWFGGVSATTTGGPTVWGWDCCKFAIPASGVSAGVGVTCGSASPQTYTAACTGLPVTLSWVVVGANTYVSFDY